MRFPRLKNALLCRILVYVVVLGSFFASMAVIVSLNFIPEIVKSIACIGLLIAFSIYLVRNFILLMAMDIQLATLHCRNTARKRFALPHSFSVDTVEKRISRFGKKYTPIPIAPTPNLLQYKSQTSMTIWASGIEKVIGATEGCITAQSNCGLLTVVGANLKLTAFSQSNGTLAFTGEITSIKYGNKTSTLKRIFK